MHHLMTDPLRSGSVRPSLMSELPLATEVSGRIGPEWVFENKPVVEQTSRHHAAALQNELRLGLHEHGANLEHPPGCRQAHSNARRLAQNSHEIRVRQGMRRGHVHDALDLLVVNQAFLLEPAPAVTGIDVSDLAALEAEAIRARPDVTLATLQQQLARASQTAARAAFFPQVSAQGGWELNGSAWNSRTSGWIVGAVARVNLFNGFADKARLAEATDRATRHAHERGQAETAARLDVHVAVARLDAARASEAVGRDAVAQARESRRASSAIAMKPG